MTLPETVHEIGQLHFEGNIVPHTWYKHLLKSVGRRGKKKTTQYIERPYLEAIIILSDIVYWYRPTAVKNEQTNEVTFKKKFAADKLQRSYGQLADHFGMGKDQARNACKWLEKRGLITIEPRVIHVRGIPLSNVIFMEPVPAAIAIINSQPTPMSQATHTPKSGDTDGVSQATDTYTETSPETSPNRIATEKTPVAPPQNHSEPPTNTVSFSGEEKPPPKQTEVSQEEPTVPVEKNIVSRRPDIFTLAAKTQAARKRLGSDLKFEAAILAFCDLMPGYEFEYLDKGMRKQWNRAMEAHAKRFGLEPGQLAEGIGKIPADESKWEIENTWKRGPYSSSLGEMAAAARAIRGNGNAVAMPT